MCNGKRSITAVTRSAAFELSSVADLLGDTGTGSRGKETTFRGTNIGYHWNIYGLEYVKALPFERSGVRRHTTLQEPRKRPEERLQCSHLTLRLCATEEVIPSEAATLFVRF